MARNNFSRILLRRGTKQELKDINPMLKQGEPISEYDTGRMKIGDGIHRYNKLKYVGGGSGGGTPSILTFNVSSCKSQSTTFSSGNVPNGCTIDTVTISYSLSASPDEVTIYYGSTIIFDDTYPDNLSGSITLDNIEINSNTEFKIIMKVDDSAVEAKAYITFRPYLYYMVSDIAEPNIGSTLTGATKKICTSRNNTLSNIDSGDTGYIFIFLPKTIFGNTAPSFKVGDFTGGFMQMPTTLVEFTPSEYVSLKNEYGYLDNCYVYRSTNSGLGVKTITIS